MSLKMKLPISLPRPRGLQARRAVEFQRIEEQITDIFLARGVLHGVRASTDERPMP